MSADAPTRTLQSALASVRSKNAGPFTVTFDLFFKDRDTFFDVVGQKVLTKEVVGALYGLEPDQVRIFEWPGGSSSSPSSTSRCARRACALAS